MLGNSPFGALTRPLAGETRRAADREEDVKEAARIYAGVGIYSCALTSLRVTPGRRWNTWAKKEARGLNSFCNGHSKLREGVLRIVWFCVVLYCLNI